MALLQAKVLLNLSWSLQKANKGFRPSRQGYDRKRWQAIIDPAMWQALAAVELDEFGPGDDAEIDPSAFDDLAMDAMKIDRMLLAVVIPRTTDKRQAQMTGQVIKITPTGKFFGQTAPFEVEAGGVWLAAHNPAGQGCPAAGLSVEYSTGDALLDVFIGIMGRR